MKQQEGVAVLVLVVAGALVAALAAAAVLERRAGRHVVTVAFWFEDVTFELPASRTQALGGPMTAEERATIRAVARSEVKQAYEGLRVTVSDARRGTYRIRVVQEFAGRPGPASAAGLARPLGPLGGQGAVNFRTVAALAMYHAPPGASRGAILEGIGRGIGRTAVHEAAHLMLFGEPVPASDDPRSYEYESPDRAAQYYGTLHWDTAWPVLMRKFGP